MTKTIINPHKEAKVRTGYPGLTGDDIQKAPEVAGLTRIETHGGYILGVGYYDPAGKPNVNIYRFDDGKLDRKFFANRFSTALKKREKLSLGNTYRLIHGQADGLPGLIVDRFGDVLVVQVRNSAIEALRDLWLEQLINVVKPKGIYERSDVQARRREGISDQIGKIYGEVPDVIEVDEDGIIFPIPLAMAQKTGFYLDQRENRRLLESMISSSDRVLDVYSYVGSFAMRAARKGAYAMAVDKDMTALSVLDRMAVKKGYSVDIRNGDAVEVLRELAKQKAKPFTHILLDPPTLIKRQDDLPKIKELLITLVKPALKLLAPGGYIWLSSCAFYLKADDLLEVLRHASAEEGKRLRLHAINYNPADHPWSINIPETLYLKTVIVQEDSL